MYFFEGCCNCGYTPLIPDRAGEETMTFPGPLSRAPASSRGGGHEMLTQRRCARRCPLTLAGVCRSSPPVGLSGPRRPRLATYGSLDLLPDRRQGGSAFQPGTRYRGGGSALTVAFVGWIVLRFSRTALTERRGNSAIHGLDRARARLCPLACDLGQPPKQLVLSWVVIGRRPAPAAAVLRPTGPARSGSPASRP